jgi:hypothetical protein
MVYNKCAPLSMVVAAGTKISTKNSRSKGLTNRLSV